MCWSLHAKQSASKERKIEPVTRPQIVAAQPTGRPNHTVIHMTPSSQSGSTEDRSDRVIVNRRRHKRKKKFGDLFNAPPLDETAEHVNLLDSKGRLVRPKSHEAKMVVSLDRDTVSDVDFSRSRFTRRSQQKADLKTPQVHTARAISNREAESTQNSTSISVDNRAF